MTKAQIVAVAVLSLTATAASAQKADFSFSWAGVFPSTATSSSGSVSDNPTNSAALFGSARYHFNRRHGVELNLGYTRNSHIFTVPPDTYRVMTGIFEYTGAYVFTPWSGEKWQPFVLVGGGGLHFNVGNTYIDNIQGLFGTNSETALTFLYGVGTDYSIFSHLGVRLQYRGLLYRNPDFGVPSRFYTGARSHMAEPALGVVIKF